MQRDAAPTRRRNRARGPRKAQQNEEWLEGDHKRQESHLSKCSLALPISTRALGLAVGRYLWDFRFALYELNSSSDSDDEGYIERVTPNLYQLYRLFLALFELKLSRVQRSWWPRYPGYVDHSFDAVGMYLETERNYFPKHVTELVNALGVVRYGDLTFVPVVAEDLYDATGKLVPMPQNLLYSNLRRAVVALANPETPEQYRIEFEAYCPIPGAIWENHLLVNADEIVPKNHMITDDCAALYRGPVVANALQGKLSDSTRGKISALVNIHKTRDIKLPPRKVGQSLHNYSAGACHYRTGNDYTTGSFFKLTDDQMKEGLDLLMFGEVPNNSDHRSALYATREESISAFPGGTYNHLTLSVSTRGIGFFLCRYLQQIKIQREKPNIYATYRAFLGLFEAKLQTYRYNCNKLNPSEVYRSSFIDHYVSDYLFREVFYLPDPISRIISAVGNVTIGQRTFTMAMASERLDETGRLIPEPQNVLISNLRRTVEALSDPETPLQHREHFELNCPIPGAIWDNHLLANADEIIPANYSISDLNTDINVWMKYARFRSTTLSQLTTNGDDDRLGKRSAFVSVTMKHPMRVEPRLIGQELATYVPSVRPTPSLACHSFVPLTPEETAEGQMMMLGERPKGETRQLYALRNPAVCGYKVVERWSFAHRW